MDFSSSSNTVIQKNTEGLMIKKAIHIRRKNCGSRNTEENNCLNTWVDGDITGDVDAKQSP